MIEYDWMNQLRWSSRMNFWACWVVDISDDQSGLKFHQRTTDRGHEPGPGGAGISHPYVLVGCCRGFQLGKWGYPKLAGWFIGKNPIVRNGLWLGVPIILFKPPYHSPQWIGFSGTIQKPETIGIFPMKGGVLSCKRFPLKNASWSPLLGSYGAINPLILVGGFNPSEKY